MNVYDETQEIMHKHKIKADKSLGQNFLVDDNIIDQIINASDIKENDMIIEIGPGLGVLTNRLLKMSNTVIAIELDKRMIEILQNRFSNNINNGSLKIINEDVLKVNLNELINKNKNDKGKVKVVANLPYYISTPIIIKLLEERLDINEIIVMVQKEVAERLTARTGTRLSGAITYAVEYYSEASKVVEVPKESFIPSPKVESEVIKLKVRKQTNVTVEDEKLLFNIIQRSFMQRRKTLSNALINYGIIKDKKQIEEMFKYLNIENNIRGENLSLEQFAKIADYINKLEF